MDNGALCLVKVFTFSWLWLVQLHVILVKIVTYCIYWDVFVGNEEFAGAYQCAICGKSFTNPVILKAHMLLHSGQFTFLRI